MKEQLSIVANEFGERVLDTPLNQISLGKLFISLKIFCYFVNC